jgi:predicted component of type VI protein secretion system
MFKYFELMTQFIPLFLQKQQDYIVFNAAQSEQYKAVRPTQLNKIFGDRP